MAGVTTKVDDAAVMGALTRLVDACGDLSGALKNIGEYGRGAIIDRIEREVTPEGTPFAPLNPLYAETKKGPGILRGESGDLSRIVYQLGVQEVEIGSNSEHAAIHHFGGTIRAKNAAALVFSMGDAVFRVKSVRIPPRPFADLSTGDRDEILEIIRDHLVDASGGALVP